MARAGCKQSWQEYSGEEHEAARPARSLDNRNYVEIGNENNFSMHTTLSGELGGGRGEGERREA